MVDFNKLNAQRRQRRVEATASAVKPLPRSFVALDLETTGFDGVNDKIIEIGAVRFTEGEPVAVFNTLVRQVDSNGNPYQLSDVITKATGHTTEDIQKGMPEEQAIICLLHFIEEDALTGHNVLFDFEFYTRSLDRLQYRHPYNPLLDTLTIARERHKYPHKLPDMCKKYNIPQEEWHSAYFDAMACGNLLLAMHAEDKDYGSGKQVVDYVNVIGWKRQYGEPTWYPSWVTLKGQGDMHVQEGPTPTRKKHTIVIPTRHPIVVPKPYSFVLEPEHKWYGKGCPKQSCQFEEEDDNGKGLGYPVLVYCNHRKNPMDSEGNCSIQLCPDEDIPF